MNILLNGPPAQKTTGEGTMKTSALARASLIAAVSVVTLPALLLQAKADPLYIQTNLVSDLPNVALITDPHLVNPWGISHSPTSPIWVSDQARNLATLYAVTSAGVTKAALEVSIPVQTPPGPPA